MAEKIGRDDWIRTSDPLNPIHRTDRELSRLYGWSSTDSEDDSWANLRAEPLPRWPLYVLIAAAVTAFGLIVLQFDHALAQAMIGHLPH
jgi:hypothetical protein